MHRLPLASVLSPLSLVLFAAVARLAHSQDGVQLRILSYNIHHCEGVDRKLDLPRIAQIIRQCQPDLVALQEVDRGTKRSGGVDQPAELARLLAMQVVFEKNIDHEGGQYGNAVLSRLPVLSHRNHALPVVDGGEQRGVLDLDVQTNVGVVRVLATHLDHRTDPRERLASIEMINRLALQRETQPTILVGDLNATWDSDVLKSATQVWSITNQQALPTIPVERPARQIDFVLTRPADRWIANETRVLDEPVASDHRPILAVVELRRPSFPGKHSMWNGFDRYDFEVGGKPLMVIAPKSPAAGNPWVWHGEFFGHKPAPDIALVERGLHIVYASIPNMLGSPQAVEHWNLVYHRLTRDHGLASKVGLVGLSRGGLYCYNWAISNPEKVACIYGDAPVCDFRSWPGGKGTGPGSAPNWKLVLDLWRFKDDAEAIAYRGNPVDSLRPLAEAGVPLLHVFGDADEVVPWEENTGLIAERYPKLGGKIELIRKAGVKHHPHGLDDSTPIVEFLFQHCSTPAAFAKVTSATATRIKNERGFVVHRLESPYQSAPTELRVLMPDNISEVSKRPVLYVLPVVAGNDLRWGDGLEEVKRLNLHNRLGLICAAPTFSQLPWYADHPVSLGIRQESYMLRTIVPLMRWLYPEASHDRDSRLLVGFSKSGNGAWSLLLRHPEVFGRAAAWDAPLAMSQPGQFGSGPIYGPLENFRKYEIHRLLRDRQAVLRQSSDSQPPIPRLIHAGYDSFADQHSATEKLLDELAIPHIYHDGPQRQHAWSSGWLEQMVTELVNPAAH